MVFDLLNQRLASIRMGVCFFSESDLQLSILIINLGVIK
jgi:hypothetical protein